MTASPDLSTRAMFDRGRLLVREGRGYAPSRQPVHNPGRLELQWETEVAARGTGLTFAEWLRAKGWR